MSRELLVLTLVSLSALCPLAQAGDTGFIQVKCAPGVQIFMDGTLQGVTSPDVGGLIIQDVTPGTHEMKAVKAGYQPQVVSISVASGKVVSFEVKSFIPKVKITETGTEQETQVTLKVGSLQIQSVPIECTLSIPALGIDGQGKTKDQWIAEDVPVGHYGIVATAMNKQLSHDVAIEENFRSEVLFNFLTGEISDIGAQRRAEQLAAELAREREVASIREQARSEGITLPPGMPFVPIKPGTFVMGSPPSESGHSNYEEPEHLVTLTSAFWMAVYEVTQEQFEAVTGNNPADTGYWGIHGKRVYRVGPKFPAYDASWEEVMSFVERLNARERAKGNLPDGWAYRLPTEAEWEYACRAGTQSAYSFGDDAGALGAYAWYDGDNRGLLYDVGQKQPNPWGLYDMYGSVEELCIDWFGPYDAGAAVDPTGPSTGDYRVARGGSVWSDAHECRSAHRPIPPVTYPGFRLVLAPVQP